MAQLQPQVKQMFLGNNGLPLVGGKLYTYLGGTTTPKATFSDPEGLVPNPNPVILDARGEALIFWTGTYKVKLTDALDNPIYTVDNVQEVSPAFRTSATGSLITPSGTTAQRDAAPEVGYARWNTSLSVFEIWNGSIWANAFVGSGASSGPGGSPLSYRNKIVGGDCRFATIGNVAYAPGTLMYGGCDNILVYSNNTTSGTILQLRAGPSIGVCGASQGIQVTSVSAGEVVFETRVEASDTRNLGGKQVTISASVYHDVGVPILASFRLSKASVTDNFTTRNNIQNSIPVGVPSGSLTRITFTTDVISVANMYDGLAIDISMLTPGVVTGKYFTVTDWQLEEGNIATPFEVRPLVVEQAMLHRFLPVIRVSDLTGQLIPFSPIAPGTSSSTSQAQFVVQFPLQAFRPPTSVVSTASGNIGVMNSVGGYGLTTGLSLLTASRTAAIINTQTAVGTPSMTAGQGAILGHMTGGGSMYFLGSQL